jgi:hypothetical protein
MSEAIERIKKHADSLEGVPHNKQFRADLYELVAVVNRPDVAAVIEKVREYGHQIGNAECCAAHYDKATERMHRQEAEGTISEITAMLASAPESRYHAEVVSVAHEYIRRALNLPDDAPHRFDFYAEVIANLTQQPAPETAGDARDAARYRFVRTRVMWDGYGPALACGLTKVDAKKTDAAIDAARQEQNDV